MTDDSGLGEGGQAAAFLRAQIWDGTVAAGQPVLAIELAAWSGSPVLACARALQRLAEEGLLIHCPGLDYYVSSRPAARAKDGHEPRVPRQRASSALRRAGQQLAASGLAEDEARDVVEVAVGVGVGLVRMLEAGGAVRPGAETVGTVAAAGPDTAGFEAGDRVGGVAFEDGYAIRQVCHKMAMYSSTLVVSVSRAQ